MMYCTVAIVPSCPDVTPCKCLAQLLGMTGNSPFSDSATSMEFHRSTFFDSNKIYTTKLTLNCAHHTWIWLPHPPFRLGKPHLSVSSSQTGKWNSWFFLNLNFRLIVPLGSHQLLISLIVVIIFIFVHTVVLICRNSNSQRQRREQIRIGVIGQTLMATLWYHDGLAII